MVRLQCPATLQQQRTGVFRFHRDMYAPKAKAELSRTEKLAKVGEYEEKLLKSWEAVLSAPLKDILILMLVFYFVGGSVGMFSIFALSFGISATLNDLFGVNAAFAAYQMLIDEKNRLVRSLKDDKANVSSLAVQKVLYVILMLCVVGFMLYKLYRNGLLPVGSRSFPSMHQEKFIA